MQNTNNLQEAILKDLRETVKTCKTKRNKDSLTAMKVIVTSVSEENVAKAKCIKRLSDELYLPMRRITGGKRVRTKVLKSKKSCWTEILRKTRNDSTIEDTKSICYKILAIGRDIETNWKQEGYKAETDRAKIIYKSHDTSFGKMSN